MKIFQYRLAHYQYGTFAILFASIFWGTTGTVASFVPEVSSLAIGAFSMGVGGLIQACLAHKQIKTDRTKILANKKVLLAGALALAIYPLAFYSSMRMAGVAVGTVISIATAPFFSVILECLYSKGNRITKRWVVSFIFGIVGITMLAFSESSASIHMDQNLRLLGVCLGLVAALTYAIYSWVAKDMIDQGITSQAALGSIFGLGAVLLLPTLVFTGDALFSSSTTMAVITYMALVPMCLSYIAFGFGLRHVKASSANLLTLFEPVVAAVLAVLIVGEYIPLLGWFGMVLIIICLFIQTKASPTAS